MRPLNATPNSPLDKAEKPCLCFNIQNGALAALWPVSRRPFDVPKLGNGTAHHDGYPSVPPNLSRSVPGTHGLRLRRRV
jgi:hypothetical protein